MTRRRVVSGPSKQYLFRPEMTWSPCTMTQSGVPLLGEKTTSISYEKAYTMKPGLMSILDTQQQPHTVGQPQQLQQQISHHETLMASANLLSPMGSGAGTGTIRFHILMVEVRNEF